MAVFSLNEVRSLQVENKNTNFTSLKKNKNVTNLNDKCWERLKSMAFETYVPESETSKSGAGY